MSASPLYMIGIDAAPLWLIKELSESGNLRAFPKLLSGKCITELRSTMPPMTGPAWPSIYTGKEPAEHGVPDFFMMKRDYTPELVYYDSKAYPPFWESLAERGKKCLIITPATDINLPESRHVEMITGFPLKSRTNSSLLRQLMKEFKFYGEPDLEKPLKEGKITAKEAAAGFAELARKRREIAMKAMQAKQYDFTFVCFTETDRIQHFVLNKKDRVEYLLPIYEEIDKLALYFMNKADEEGAELILVSDHGAQPIKSKFLINAWLMSKGYLSIKGGAMKSAPVQSPGNGFRYNVREKLIKTNARKVYDRLPHAAKKAVSASLGAVLPSAAVGEYTRMHLFDFDMLKTKAFAAISNLNVSTIWINDGRFDMGIVTQSEKQFLKRKLSKELIEAKGAGGKKVIKRVIDADPYYHGTGKFLAPDLFAEAMPGYSLDIFNFSPNRLFMPPEPPKSGDHTTMGIFGLYPHRQAKPGEVAEVKPMVLKHFSFKRQTI